MDLPDLTSDDILLGLDLVASWQLDQVKALDLWSRWPPTENLKIIEQYLSDGKSAMLLPTGLNSDFLRISLPVHREDCSAEKQGDQVVAQPDMHYTIDWTEGRCLLLVYTSGYEWEGLWLSTLPEQRRKCICAKIGCDKPTIRDQVCSKYCAVILQQLTLATLAYT